MLYNLNISGPRFAQTTSLFRAMRKAAFMRAHDNPGFGLIIMQTGGALTDLSSLLRRPFAYASLSDELSNLPVRMIFRGCGSL
jgi:hypothetical protein